MYVIIYSHIIFQFFYFIILYMLCIIFFIILLVLIYNNYTFRETFDQRVDGATKEQCGILCTKTLGCAGFSYNEDNNFCYISKDPIVLNPEKKNYSAFYKSKFPRCNKLYVVSDPYYNSRNNIIRNATYECMDKENDIDNKKYIIYDVKEKTDINIDNLNKQKISPYTFVDIEWDDWLLSQDKKNLPINLDKNLHLITNPTESNSINIMQEQDKYEYSGEYLFPHKCSRNITKNDCMKQCLEDENCIGTEWNPILIKKIGEPNKYIFDENICCPLKKINKKTPRRKDMRFGNFYLKENVLKQDLQQSDIFVEYKNKIKNEENNNNTSKYANWNHYDF